MVDAVSISLVVVINSDEGSQPTASGPFYILHYDMSYSENYCVSAPSCNTDDVQFHARVIVLWGCPRSF